MNYGICGDEIFFVDLGPIGGVGFAFSAGICNLMYPEIFLAITLIVISGK